MNTLTAVAPREITRDEFRTISELLHARTGIRLVPGKETLVMGRLFKRMRELGLDRYGDYFALLDGPDDNPELRRAIDLLTTNETFFFREPQHFEYLSRVLAPGHREARPFTVWSAACSSGEEAYTAAMVLSEALPNRPWEIVGTDISTRVVQRARCGVYPIEAADRIPRSLLRRYCRKGREEYEGMMAVSPQLRSRVDFTVANLLDDLHRLGRFDVIMLRNVMIYFELDTKIELIGKLEQMLHPGGHLIVSLSESLNGIPSRLRAVGPSIYQLGGGARVATA